MATATGGALVVGASSGIGAALARQLASQGYRLALVARRAEALQALADELNQPNALNALGAGGGEPRVYSYASDVTDYDMAPEIFARVAREVAPLRLVVYAAGVMPHVTTGADFAAERETIETNVLGAMRWLGLAADYFEEQRGGTIVGISSVAGDRGRPGSGAYQASKAALSSYLDSLRFRLQPAGVRVVTIKPGYVATPLLAGARTPRALTVTPEAAARGILAATQRGAGVVYVPGYWRAIMWLVRRLPASLVARLPG